MMVSYLGLGVVSILVVAITWWICRWKNPRWSGRGELPPGSMGLPFIGETIQLIIPNYSLDLPPFFKKRLNKYGRVFKTNIAGRPMIVSADPELNHYIWRQDNKLVELWYMDLFDKVFKQDENGPDGDDIHKYVRNLALSHFGSERLKAKLLFQVEEMINKTLDDWANIGSVEVQRAVSAMCIGFGAKQIFSYDPEKSPLNLVERYINFTKSLMSFPLNIPGTSYHRCLKEHQKGKNLMMRVMNDRQASGEVKGDLLDKLLESMQVESFLTNEFVAQLIFALVYVFDSISTTITLALKLLEENPAMLQDLIAEHENIVKRRENPNSPLSWEEYKSMAFTLYVINETLRIGSFAPGVMRRAKENIQMNGYNIPKGWGIIFLSSALQLNPNTYENHMTFNPWRWKDLSKSVVSKNFMPFGWGMKQCAGADFVRMFTSIFLHTLVTKYRWKKIGGGDIVRTPILVFPKGLHINVSKKEG